MGSGNRPTKAVWNLGAGYENAGYFVDAGYVAFQTPTLPAPRTATTGVWKVATTPTTCWWLWPTANPSTTVNATPPVLTPPKAKRSRPDRGLHHGRLTPKFTYAHVWDTKTNGVKADDGINQYVIGVDYALSKRTTAYTSFGYVKHDNIIVAGTDERKERTLAVGVQHKF